MKNRFLITIAAILSFGLYKSTSKTVSKIGPNQQKRKGKSKGGRKAKGMINGLPKSSKYIANYYGRYQGI